MSPDAVNGMFELLGAVFLVANCVRLYRDKQIKGVSPLPIVFFTVWGLWNLYFYPSVGAMWSFWGGIGRGDGQRVLAGTVGLLPVAVGTGGGERAEGFSNRRRVAASCPAV